MVKIFSSFDTGLMKKVIQVQQDEFGPKNILAIRRDFIYLFYRVLFPVLLRLVGSAIILWIVYVQVTDSGLLGGLLRMSGLLIIFAWGWYCAGIARIKLIDYYMDFTIITPKQVLSFDQYGLFDKTTRTLDTEKIKSMIVDKKGFLGSVFNYGSIVFLSEGDAEDLGEIKLNYMSDPNALREKIQKIIEPHIHGKNVIKYYTKTAKSKT